VSELA
jgi:hypothetical protein